MLRHSDNCTGEVVVEENGTPTPRKSRRGRKRKMQSRRDDDDDDDTGKFVCSINVRDGDLFKMLTIFMVC